MAEYLEINIELKSRQESVQEYILALLSAFGFEGFKEDEGRIAAYISSESFSEDKFESFLESFNLNEKIKSLVSAIIPEQNWNAKWEEDYSPVQIQDRCLVRAPFHLPRKGIQYDIIISPKMSFGTAHHDTTSLMLEFVMDNVFDGQKVLDFGCGTGVLAILAEKLGAREITALDNDVWAWNNAIENTGLNDCRNIKVVQGELDSIEEEDFDVILGNINLNILLKDMENISARMSNGGLAILSGFYQDDLKILSPAAREYGLSLIQKQTRNRWTVGVYRKGD